MSAAASLRRLMIRIHKAELRSHVHRAHTAALIITEMRKYSASCHPAFIYYITSQRGWCWVSCRTTAVMLTKACLSEDKEKTCVTVCVSFWDPAPPPPPPHKKSVLDKQTYYNNTCILIKHIIKIWYYILIIFDFNKHTKCYFTPNHIARSNT